MQRNATREKLERGEAVFGCFLRYPDAGLAELLALQGLDFVVFDGEHGTLAPRACEQLARAVELHGVTPSVRVEENRAVSILRYLDAGALIVHVPGVDSREDAVRAVRAVKFRPQGDRGLSASRASGFGARDGYPAYIAHANRETQVIVHIESAAGVEAVEEIAAVDGVDVLLFGALDLSHDLGRPGEVEHPELVACAERVAAAAAAAGKVLGAVSGDARGVRRWLDRGARYVLVTVESFVTPGVERFLTEARA
ncbi:MAG TPA: aldolase/citrate lyase family protein [Conexibacter sp.]|nr:aldolase/citrate lyase family protein [Conexibacter sp.]